MQTHDYTKPPRTMPTTFARQEQTIRRLTEENKALREKLVLLEDGMSPHLAEVAETDTHFILLGTPGGHNCDEMGCGSVGHHVLMRVHKSEIPNSLQTELDAIRTAMRAYPDSDLASLAATLAASDEAHGELLAWSQAAYTRLNALMTIGVSMTPDAVTKRLLEDAPGAVKGGEKSQS